MSNITAVFISKSYYNALVCDTSNALQQKKLEYRQTNSCKSRNAVDKCKGVYTQAINLK